MKYSHLIFILLSTAFTCVGQSQINSAQSSSPLLNTRSTQELLVDAILDFRKGKFDTAINEYQTVLKNDPKCSDAYAGLARVYLKEKNPQLASETIAKGTQLADAPAVQVALGEVLFRQGKIPEAEKEWVDVINSGNLDARAFWGLYRVSNAISMYKRARTMLEKAHELDPNDPQILQAWIGTLRGQERIEALQLYLASPNNDDPETRQEYQDWLKALIAEEKYSANHCTVSSHLTTAQVPLTPLMMDPTHMEGYGLRVQINGETASLLLDTGASGIVINSKLAKKAGVIQLSGNQIDGYGDKPEVHGYIGLANSIKIGDLELKNCEVEVSDKRSVVFDAGLISANMFRDFLVDIDFPQQILRLSELPRRPADGNHPTAPDATGSAESPKAAATTENSSKAPSGRQDRYIAPEMSSYIRIFRDGDALFIPTRIGALAPKLFLMDTGALVNDISLNAARELTKLRNSDLTVIGVRGAVNNVYSADKATLEFGHFRQENIEMLALDMDRFSEDYGIEISGSLGLSTLRQLDIKIDYRDGLIDMHANGKSKH